MRTTLSSCCIALLFASTFTMVPERALAQPTAGYPDKLIQMQIEQRFPEFGLTKAAVAVHEGTVTLTGSVPSLWLKDQAVVQARTVHGVVDVVSTLTVSRAVSDDVVARQFATDVSACPDFTIFDDVTARVTGGVATLTGFVTIADKAQSYVDVASRVAGVQQIVNRVETLPASMMDDDLRLEIGVGIYKNPVFAAYAHLRTGPVHIVVRDGIVTLTGVVVSEVERRTAEMIARDAIGAWSVDNQLRLRH